MAARRSEQAPAPRKTRAAAAPAKTSVRPAAVSPAPSSRTRAAAKPTAPTPAPLADACQPDKAAGFWQASLRALDNVRNDVQRRQANVIESLLGIGPAAGADPRLSLPGLPGLDAFGLRKFEDVFDQRVAAALERLGMPTRDELQALQAKLDEVLARLDPTGTGAGEAPPAAKAVRRSRPKAR